MPTMPLVVATGTDDTGEQRGADESGNSNTKPDPDPTTASTTKATPAAAPTETVGPSTPCCRRRTSCSTPWHRPGRKGACSAWRPTPTGSFPRCRSGRPVPGGSRRSRARPGPGSGSSPPAPIRRSPTAWTSMIELRSGSLQLEGFDVILPRDNAPSQGRWAAFAVWPATDLSLTHCTVTVEGDQVVSAVVAVEAGETRCWTTGPIALEPSAATVRVTDSLLRTGGDLVDVGAGRRLVLEMDNAVVATGRSLRPRPRRAARPGRATASSLTLRQVTARMAGGLVQLESTPGEPELPVADINARYSIFATTPKDAPLIRVDGQDAASTMRDRIVWEGHGVGYHSDHRLPPRQSSQVGAVPIDYDRSSWIVAVGAREQMPVHGDLKFRREWDPDRPAWTLGRDDVRLSQGQPRAAPPAPTSTGSPTRLAASRLRIAICRCLSAGTLARGRPSRSGRSSPASQGRHVASSPAVGPRGRGGTGRPRPAPGGSGTSRRATRRSEPFDPVAALGRDRPDRPLRRSGSQAAGRSALLATTKAALRDGRCREGAGRPSVERLGAVERRGAQVGLGLPVPGQGDPRGLDRVGRVAQAGRVGQLDGPAVERGPHGHHVAGRAGRRVDDRPVVAGQGVQEPALADVRPARQHDRPARDQPEPDARPSEQPLDGFERRLTARLEPVGRSRPPRARARPCACSSRISAVRSVGARARSTSASAAIGDRASCRTQAAGLPPLGPGRDQGLDHQGRPARDRRDSGSRPRAARRRSRPPRPRRPGPPRSDRTAGGPAGVSASRSPRAGRNAASTTSSARRPQTRTTASAPRPSGVSTQSAGRDVDRGSLAIAAQPPWRRRRSRPALRGPGRERPGRRSSRPRPARASRRRRRSRRARGRRRVRRPGG